MRHGYAILRLALGAFITTTVGCTHVAEAPPPPKRTMVFKRDIYNGKGCLEYSWLSEDRRRLIQLNPSIKEGEGEGPSASGASHVQVYALTNGQYSLKDWQFPAGPRHSSPILSAAIELKEIEAVGTVIYQDGSSATDTKALVPMPVNCPGYAQNAARVDPEITKLDPGKVSRNTAVTITLFGSHFTRDSVVLIDGANPSTQFVSSSMLEAAVDADDLAIPGKRMVKVHGANRGTTSNEVTLTVE